MPRKRTRSSAHIDGALLSRVLPLAGRVRWIHSLWTGVEGILTPELWRHPAPLTNGRGVFRWPLADWVAAAMLFFAFDLRRVIQQQEQGVWNPFVATTLDRHITDWVFTNWRTRHGLTVMTRVSWIGGPILVVPHRIIPVAALVTTIGVLYEALREERHLLRTFGERYARYLERTGRFAPRLFFSVSGHFDSISRTKTLRNHSGLP